MANITIAGLSSRTSLAATDVFEVDNAATTDDSEKVTFALLGGLEVGAVVTANSNQTGSAGVLTRWDISAMATSDKTWTLPASASIQVGERAGLYIDTTNASFEVPIRTAAAGDTIDGTDRSSASGGHKIWQRGEYMQYLCVANGGAGSVEWITERDGRIAQMARMIATAQQTGIVTATFTKVTFGSAPVSIGATVDLTNERVTVRRDGYFNVGGFFIFSNVEDQNSIILQVRKNGSAIGRVNQATISLAAAGAGGFAGNALHAGTDGDYFELFCWHNQGTNRSSNYTAGDSEPFFNLTEILNR